MDNKKAIQELLKAIHDNIQPVYIKNDLSEDYVLAIPLQYIAEEVENVKNIIDICVRGGKEIQEITGVDKPKANNWVFQCQKMLEQKDLIRKSDMTVSELLAYQQNYPRLATKCTEVDDLFGGGVIPEAVYEVYGEFGSGKTQFCLSLTAEALAKDEKVIWIDCEDTFRPTRLKEILTARELLTDEEADVKLI